MTSLKGKSLIFIEKCGPIPEGVKALCIEDCRSRNIIRLWLSQSVCGVKEFVLSRKHIEKMYVFV
jgi:hypothetical protein